MEFARIEFAPVGILTQTVAVVNAGGGEDCEEVRGSRGSFLEPGEQIFR